MYLQLSNLVKEFAGRGGPPVRAVDDVNLVIEKGDLVTLLGPSGCGKTTTLRLVAGFEFPTAGEIVLDGQQINDTPPNRREMSMVFQSYAIFPHLSVFENIAYGLRIQRLSEAEIRSALAAHWTWWNFPAWKIARPTSLAAGSSSAWRWRGRW
jgi:iron(III) transport system ATP-binding protein